MEEPPNGERGNRVTRPRRALARPRVLLVGALVGVVVLAGLGWFAVDAAGRARDVRAEVQRAEVELRRAQATVQSLARLDAGHLPSAEEIEDALTAVRAARTHLVRSEDRLGYLAPLLPVAAAFPPARGAGEAPALLDLGLDVTGAAGELLVAVLPLLQPPGPTEAAEAPPLAERLRGVFVQDGARLDGVLARLDAARPEVDRLRAREWGSLLDAAPPALDLLAGALEEVPRAREAFAAIRQGLDPLFGFDRPRTYLVAGLNESELRPTGGFMGTLGVVSVEQGRITASEFERVYAFERPLEAYPAPPDDLALAMGAGHFLLRDANWWPDFPTSAEATLDFFEVNQGVRPDGVIAINTLLTGRLVEVFEPLDLPEYPQVLTAANWRGVMETTLLEGRDELGQVSVLIEEGEAVRGEAGSAEEAYLHPLMEALIARSQDAEAAQIPALVAALHAGSRARDLQAYVADPDAQAMLDAFAVTGRLEGPSAGEAAAGEHVVAVVDSNVSWSKVQPGVHRDTTVLMGERGVMDVTVRWQNRVPELDPAVYPRAAGHGAVYSPGAPRAERADGVFGNWVRVYLPQGARNLQVAGATSSAPRVTFEDGFTVVSALVVVPAGEARTFTVSFRPPEPARVLTIWKQGGQAHDTLRVLHNQGSTQEVLLEGVFAGDQRVEVP